MTEAIRKSRAAPPDDPVAKAVEDPNLQAALVNHALAILSRHLANRAVADRLESAREACQETCFRALQKRNDHDPALPVGPWLHGILNKVLSETNRSILRSPAQGSSDSDQWQGLKASLDSDAAETVPGCIDVAFYLARLPPEDSGVLRLRFFEGLGHDEIATRLGISIGNARVRLCRALAAAKKIAGVAKEDQP